MFNDAQAEKVAKDLGLSYRFESPNGGAKYIIVEETIAYSHYACKIKILRDGEVVKNITSNTTKRFKELCKDLAQNK